MRKGRTARVSQGGIQEGGGVSVSQCGARIRKSGAKGLSVRLKQGSGWKKGKTMNALTVLIEKKNVEQVSL